MCCLDVGQYKGKEILSGVHTGQGDVNTSDADFDDRADFKQASPDCSCLGTGHARAFESASAQLIDQHVGHGREVQTELIGSHCMATGPIREHIQLLLLYSIFHVTACTVDFLVEPFGVSFFLG